jgi:hypothetical protein
MTWSFSINRLFRKCQRQWFYKACFASALANDPLRHEAYLLSKLQTVAGWRGQVVDATVEDVLVPALNRGERPLLKDMLKAARTMFDSQLAFGRANRFREPGLKVSQAGREFAAFYAVEYGDGLSNDEVDRAWHDVENAFRTLYTMEELKRLLRDGKYRVAQRALTFDHSGAKVKAVPDLIVFFTDRAPAIVDWKVHAFGVHDYKDQLITYAIALARTSPHKDFPLNGRRWRETETELFEVQLIRGLVRRHLVEDADFEAADDRIAEGITTIGLAANNRDDSELHAEDFTTAYDPRACQTCSFRKICWTPSL